MWECICLRDSLKTRFLEHCRPSSTSSEVLKHLHVDCPGHSIKLERAKILNTETHLYERGVKEAIYIRGPWATLQQRWGSPQTFISVDEHPESPTTTQASPENNNFTRWWGYCGSIVASESFRNEVIYCGLTTNWCWLCLSRVTQILKYWIFAQILIKEMTIHVQKYGKRRLNGHWRRYNVDILDGWGLMPDPVPPGQCPKPVIT